jgi:hypothetical protein
MSTRANQTVERMAGPLRRLPIRELVEGQLSLTFALALTHSYRRANLKGWQNVAGGRCEAETSGRSRLEISHPGGMPELCDPCGVGADSGRRDPVVSLRSTTGYILAGLRPARAGERTGTNLSPRPVGAKFFSPGQAKRRPGLRRPNICKPCRGGTRFSMVSNENNDEPDAGDELPPRRSARSWAATRTRRSRST